MKGGEALYACFVERLAGQVFISQTNTYDEHVYKIHISDFWKNQKKLLSTIP